MFPDLKLYEVVRVGRRVPLLPQDLLTEVVTNEFLLSTAERILNPRELGEVLLSAVSTLVLQNQFCIVNGFTTIEKMN